MSYSIYKKHPNTMKPVHVAIAAAGGALVGAAAALLLAPKTGAATRQDIVDFIKTHCPLLKNKKVAELAEQIEADLLAANNKD